MVHIYSAFQLAKYQRLRRPDGSDDDWRLGTTILIDVVVIFGAVFLLAEVVS